MWSNLLRFFNLSLGKKSQTNNKNIKDALKVILRTTKSASWYSRDKCIHILLKVFSQNRSQKKPYKYLYPNFSPCKLPAMINSVLRYIKLFKFILDTIKLHKILIRGVEDTSFTLTLRSEIYSNYLGLYTNGTHRPTKRSSYSDPSTPASASRPSSIYSVSSTSSESFNSSTKWHSTYSWKLLSPSYYGITRMLLPYWPSDQVSGGIPGLCELSTVRD